MFKLILLFLKFSIYFFHKNGVLYLPFTKEVPDLSYLSPENLTYKGLHYNKIKTEISIGTEPQIIPMIIDLYHYNFFIAGEKGDYNKSSIIFKQSKSTTFSEFGKISSFGDRGFSIGYKSSDYFYFNNDDKEKKYNISFVLAEDPDDGISGIIGLKLKENDGDEEIIEYNFIRQLKKVNAINNYFFTIKYVNDTFGFLIIGDLPEMYDINYENLEYRDTYIIEPDSPSSWNIKFDSIYTQYPNNSEINDLGDFKAYFRIDFGVTIGSEEYRKEFLNNFMLEQINKGICLENYISYYYVYYCNNTVDFSKMKNLYFYSKNLNYSFEFTYKDLFYYNKLDNKYYFLIEFERNNYNGRWLIGEFFFKKYQLVFNQDTKKIGLYIGNNNKKSKSKNNNWLKRNKWYLILIIFLFILLVVLAFLTYYIIKNKPSRKKKANELIDDDYDYTINNENEK